jgi:virginiamycin B lyase
MQINRRNILGSPAASRVKRNLWFCLIAIEACVLCFTAGVLLKPPSATAVAILQLPLPSTNEPANLVFSWSGGIIISGGPKYAYEHVTVQPFAVTPGPSGDEILAATVGPNDTPWYVSSTPSGTTLIPQIDELSASGSVSRYSYPPGFPPHSIAFGADGALWLASADSIERYVPDGGITSFPAGRPTEMIAGPDGFLWFTDEADSTVGRISVKGEVMTYPLSGGASVFETPAEPEGIAVGPEGALWIAEQNLGRIGRLMPSGEFREFPIPLPSGLPPGLPWQADPRYIAAGAEGDMWFTDPGTESVGRVTPSGEITEYRIPPPPKGAYRTGVEGYLVPNHIAAVPGGLLFTEDDAKALGFVKPFAPASPVAHSMITPSHSSGARHKMPICADIHRDKNHAHRSTHKKAACSRLRHRG